MTDGYSLADLADLDVTDIEEVRFSNLPAGIYEFEVGESQLEEYTKDGDTKFKASIPLKVLEVKTVLEPGVDKDSLVGKVHTEALFVDPTKPQDDVKKAIGRIRAFVTDVGMSSEGKLGDIVRNLKGHNFTGKIVKQKDRDDKTIEYSRIKLDDKSKK